MAGAFPLWVIIIDYGLGVVMWTLIGRTAMNMFQPENSDFFFMKAFVKLTDPLIRLWKPITPQFLLPPLVPLYVAWFFYLARFYLMPYLLGYSVMGMLSFPLEGEVAARPRRRNPVACRHGPSARSDRRLCRPSPRSRCPTRARGPCRRHHL